MSSLSVEFKQSVVFFLNFPVFIRQFNSLLDFLLFLGVLLPIVASHRVGLQAVFAVLVAEVHLIAVFGCHALPQVRVRLLTSHVLHQLVSSACRNIARRLSVFLFLAAVSSRSIF